MENQTVTEWLVENKVSEEDINFIETVLTFTTSIKKLPDRQKMINERLQSLFPNKNAIIKSDLTYQQFVHILRENGIEANPGELLNKYYLQGVCVDLCDEWLNQKKTSYF